MKKLLITVTALTFLSGHVMAEGTYPIFSSKPADCVVWAIVPFPCHNGFDYEEPGRTDTNDIPAAITEDGPDKEEGPRAD